MGFDGSILKDGMETVMAEGSLGDNSIEKSSEVLVGKEGWRVKLNDEKRTECDWKYLSRARAMKRSLTTELCALNVSFSITSINGSDCVPCATGDSNE